MKRFKQFLIEKLIVLDSGNRYGNIIFLAGGAGSGKGFAISKFIDSSSYKIIDVDELKTAIVKLKAYPELQNINFKNPEDVSFVHEFVKKKNLKNKIVDLLLSNKNADKLPNLIFDITFKDFDDIDTKALLDIGYQAKNIHLIWVLSNFELSIKRNADRERTVSREILYKTHAGAAENMIRVLKQGIHKGLNGQISIIINNKENTKYFENSKVIKDFTYYTVKKQGKEILPFDKIKEMLYDTIIKNIPSTIKL